MSLYTEDPMIFINVFIFTDLCGDERICLNGHLINETNAELLGYQLLTQILPRPRFYNCHSNSLRSVYVHLYDWYVQFRM